MTTVHAYTNDQQILDLPHKDLRRARAAGMSIIPTTTGAAGGGLVLPELEGKLNGFAMRVPTPNVSVVDLVAELERDVTAEEVNEALRRERKGALKGILGFSEEPLVSSDLTGIPTPRSSTPLSTMVIGRNLVKVVAWYDNEWGYSTGWSTWSLHCQEGVWSLEYRGKKESILLLLMCGGSGFHDDKTIDRRCGCPGKTRVLRVDFNVPCRTGRDQRTTPGSAPRCPRSAI